MFTGLIEEVGTVAMIDHAGRLDLVTQKLGAKVQLGDSVAINGCCLTVARRAGNQLGFDVLQESFARTNLKNLRAGCPVNLECAVAAGAPLGGHFVQGHVDCAAPILALEESAADLRMEIELPPEFARYVAYKGSIAVNGISLTVAEILLKSFAVWIIPHTRTETNFATTRAGELVNLEFDLLAKYVERILDRDPAPRA
jgi:riboflavin synthase